MSNTLLDPKNDFVFKKLFVNAPDLLADLINAVRSDEDPVEVIDILNPQIEPEELTGKFILLDVLARDSRGRLFNIEMQVRRLAEWIERSLYYIASAYAGQLKKGGDYATLKPVIGINLLDFDLFGGRR
ncbi:MAG: Rpn family recombination-promoting nuclease/putative transposase [Porticoccaceae bacterium]